MNQLLHIPRRIAMLSITAYQKTLSPDHGVFSSRYPHGFCRHYPTCSQYAKEAIGRFGLFKGGLLALLRIMKCNPWTEPSVDNIPRA